MNRRFLSFLCRGPEGSNIADLAEEAQRRHLSGEGPLGEVVTKIAQHNGLNPDQWERLSQLANHVVHDTLFKTATNGKDRYVVFDVARPEKVARALAPRPIPARPSTTTIAKTAEARPFQFDSWFPGQLREALPMAASTGEPPGLDRAQDLRAQDRIFQKIARTCEHEEAEAQMARARLEARTREFLKEASDLVLRKEATLNELGYAFDMAFPDNAAVHPKVVRTVEQEVEKRASSDPYERPDYRGPKNVDPGLVVDFNHPVLQKLAATNAALLEAHEAAGRFGRAQELQRAVLGRIREGAASARFSKEGRGALETFENSARELKGTADRLDRVTGSPIRAAGRAADGARVGAHAAELNTQDGRDRERARMLDEGRRDVRRLSSGAGREAASVAGDLAGWAKTVPDPPMIDASGLELREPSPSFEAARFGLLGAAAAPHAAAMGTARRMVDHPRSPVGHLSYRAASLPLMSAAVGASAGAEKAMPAGARGLLTALQAYAEKGHPYAQATGSFRRTLGGE